MCSTDKKKQTTKLTKIGRDESSKKERETQKHETGDKERRKKKVTRNNRTIQNKNRNHQTKKPKP